MKSEKRNDRAGGLIDGKSSAEVKSRKNAFHRLDLEDLSIDDQVPLRDIQSQSNRTTEANIDLEVQSNPPKEPGYIDSS